MCLHIVKSYTILFQAIQFSISHVYSTALDNWTNIYIYLCVYVCVYVEFNKYVVFRNVFDITYVMHAKK